jgi:hypothetical protein
VFNCSVLTLSVINFHREIEPYEFVTTGVAGGGSNVTY